MVYTIRAIREGKLVKLTRGSNGSAVDDVASTFAVVRRLLADGFQVRVKQGERLVLDTAHGRAPAEGQVST